MSLLADIGTAARAYVSLAAGISGVHTQLRAVADNFVAGRLRDFDHYLDDVEARALRFLTNGAAGSVCAGHTFIKPPCDGAEWLAEMEEEMEVWEPQTEAQFLRNNETSPAAAGAVGDGPAEVSDTSASPSAGHTDLELPWAVEDFTSVHWHTGMPYGISNKWHEVIAHFDRREAAAAVVERMNREHPQPMESGQDMGASLATEFVG